MTSPPPLTGGHRLGRSRPSFPPSSSIGQAASTGIAIAQGIRQAYDCMNDRCRRSAEVHWHGVEGKEQQDFLGSLSHTCWEEPNGRTCWLARIRNATRDETCNIWRQDGAEHWTPDSFKPSNEPSHRRDFALEGAALARTVRGRDKRPHSITLTAQPHVHAHTITRHTASTFPHLTNLAGPPPSCW